MKFTANKSELLTALSYCLSVADPRSTMPALANVHLEANAQGLQVSATDIARSINVNVRAKIDDAGSLCLPARDLYDRVKLLPDGEIALSTEGTKATLKTVGSARRFTMHGIPSEEFPSIPEPKRLDAKLETSTHKLAALFGHVHHAVSTDASRVQLNSLMFEADDSGMRLVGTDGHRLSAVLNGDEPKAIPWLVPLAAVNDLRKLFDTKNDQSVTLRQEGPTLFVELPEFTFSTKLVDSQFPPWRQIVPSSSERTVTIDREALINALRAVAVSSGLKTGAVKFTFRKGALMLQAESPESGDGFDEVPTDYDGKTAEVGFNAKYMLDALGAISAPQVTISTSAALDPAVIRAADSESFMAVVMPLRV